MDNGAHSPTGEAHPGQIVHDDKVDGRTWTAAAADVPKTIAWVDVNGTWKAVVRIEITGTQDHQVRDRRQDARDHDPGTPTSATPARVALSGHAARATDSTPSIGGSRRGELALLGADRSYSASSSARTRDSSAISRSGSLGYSSSSRFSVPTTISATAVRM